MHEDVDPVAEMMDQPRRAGWSLGDAGFTGGACDLVWLVSGSNGENLIRAEGPTREAAWKAARDQAAAVGMFGTRRRPSAGGG